MLLFQLIILQCWLLDYESHVRESMCILSFYLPSLHLNTVTLLMYICMCLLLLCSELLVYSVTFGMLNGKYHELITF